MDFIWLARLGVNASASRLVDQAQDGYFGKVSQIFLETLSDWVSHRAPMPGTISWVVAC